MANGTPFLQCLVLPQCLGCGSEQSFLKQRRHLHMRLSMKIGDLVTYGKWYRHNVHGSMRIGVILEKDKDPNASYLYVMWSGEEAEWEIEDDLALLHEEVLNESR
jgi:hypothetical protein